MSKALLQAAGSPLELFEDTGTGAGAGAGAGSGAEGSAGAADSSTDEAPRLLLWFPPPGLDETTVQGSVGFQPGTWFEGRVAANRRVFTLHVLEEYGRRLLPRCVYSSDNR